MNFINLDIAKRTKIIVGTGILLIAAVVIIFSVKIPYTINVPGKILYSNEWIITINANGGIQTYLVNRASGVTNQFTIAQFNRGDAVQLLIDTLISKGKKVSKGDVVGSILSSELEKELERLNGELLTSNASLVMVESGEKESIVEEAKQEVERAKRQSEDLKAILLRQKALFEKGLSSQQEYELAERRAKVSSIDILISESKLKSVSSGAKKEQVDFIKAQIKSLQGQIDVLKKQLQVYNLVSPVSGVVTKVSENDTLLVISDTAEYVVLMPIPLIEYSLLESKQIVNIFAVDVQNIPSARITNIDKVIQPLNGHQVVIATASIENSSSEFLNGLLARCSIKTESMPILNYLKRKLHLTL